jgi:transcriptional regulator GlxA family with amidase domain
VIAQKVARQPKACPSNVPAGTPSMFAAAKAAQTRATADARRMPTATTEATATEGAMAERGADTASEQRPVTSARAHTDIILVAIVAGRHKLESLAAVVGMSPQNLIRHFVQATGITPHEFIERARVDAARMMLEGSDRPLKAVAFDCGFGSADRMRIVFSTRLGVTPVQYRASFRPAESD